MNPKNTIKIIKRVQRGSDRKIEAERPSTNENEQKSTRNVVTAWVKEFQQRRYTDPRRSFASLFNSADPRLASS
ncbi:MAG: hypothetical protein WCF57_02770 [Pyrinomonadaceae bacterium]